MDRVSLGGHSCTNTHEERVINNITFWLLCGYPSNLCDNICYVGHSANKLICRWLVGTELNTLVQYVVQHPFMVSYSTYFWLFAVSEIEHAVKYVYSSTSFYIYKRFPL